MLSAGVLEAEKEVIDGIIEYKNTQKIDCDFFQIKKDLIDGQIQNIQNMIISESLTLEGYKQNCSTQLNYENKLLEFLKNDKKVSEKESKIIKERINKRIEILNSELQQEVAEEEEEEENGDKNEENDENKENQNEPKTEEDTQKNSQEENHAEEIKIRGSIKEIEIKDKFLYDTLKKRVYEYHLAVEYFDKHNLPIQSKEAFNRIKDLNKAMHLMEIGKEDLSDLEIPESITPDFISGCSKQERFEKFSKLIKEYNNIKNELINKRNKVLERFNLLEKKEQNKIVFFNIIFFKERAYYSRY